MKTTHRLFQLMVAVALLVPSAEAAEFFVGGPMPVAPGQEANCSLTSLHPTQDAFILLKYFTENCGSANEYSQVLPPGRSSTLGTSGEVLSPANVVCVIEVTAREGKSRFKRVMQGAMTVTDDKGAPLASVPLVYTTREHPCFP